MAGLEDFIFLYIILHLKNFLANILQPTRIQLAICLSSFVMISKTFGIPNICGIFFLLCIFIRMFKNVVLFFIN